MLKPVALLVSCGLLASCNAGTSISSGTQTFSSGVGGAVTAPLEDLNLKREDIPEVLLQARANPYVVTGLRRCSAIAAEIGRLDDALGPDIDAPAAEQNATMDQQAAALALDAVRSTATDFIPFRSWVRRLSGAAQHSREVQTAIRAGLSRRAFLKGVGMQRNCAPPAAPFDYRPRG